MHARTKLRHAVRDALVAADIAGGNVHTHDPRVIGKNALPLVVIEPEMEKSVEVKGPRGPGRLQVRTVTFSVTVYADTTYGYAADDEHKDLPTSVILDGDDAADEISERIEAALLGPQRLFFKNQDGVPVRLGDRDLTLIGTGGVRNPETGGRQIGTVHMLFEALILTEEGNPSNTINR